MTAALPAVSVIVPATDAPATLAACTEAIGRSSRPGCELIVVSDAALCTPAAARNAGAIRARGEILVFVDADVVVRPDAIELLAGRLAHTASLAAVFGSYDDDPRAPGVVSAYRFLLHRAVHHAAAGPAQTFWSGLGAVRREAFFDVGGFDSGRRWLEDVDLGLRMRAAGHEIWLDPRAQGKHLKQLTLGAMVRSDVFERALPWTVLLLRRRRGAGVLNLGPRHRLSALASLVLARALARRRLVTASLALTAIAALNRSLIAAVGDARGNLAALLVVPLHALHHLCGLAGAALGAARWLLDGRPRGSAGDLDELLHDHRHV